MRDFAYAIERDLGAAPDPDRIVPGRIVRFSTNGKRGDDSGWCKLFEDGRAGVYGNWRTGEQYSWRDSARPTIDRKQDRERIAAAQAARIEEQAQRQARAAEAAQMIWTRAQRCDAHPYLQRKHVQPDGVRVQFAHAAECRGLFSCKGERLRGLLLLVPMRDIAWRVQSLQAIDQEGRKSFLKGARATGAFHLVGAEKLRGVAPPTYDGAIALAEGYATAWSIAHELDGLPTFVAFYADNLVHVARAVRARFPRARVTVCGDHNLSGVGQRKAEEAAASIDGLVAIPPFIEANRDRGQTDWNDYAASLRSKEHA